MVQVGGGGEGGWFNQVGGSGSGWEHGSGVRGADVGSGGGLGSGVVAQMGWGVVQVVRWRGVGDIFRVTHLINAKIFCKFCTTPNNNKVEKYIFLSDFLLII